MDTQLFLPFAESIQSVFSTMLGLDVSVGEIEPVGISEDHDVSGIIGLSGDVTGNAALCFSAETAGKIIESFVGMEMDPGSEDFADAIGELANMVAGSAKAMYDGLHVSLSCPSVVVGLNHKIRSQKELPAVKVPCDCAHGSFFIEVTLKRTSDAQTAAA
jgi:chemotaxis protein CheX